MVGSTMQLRNNCYGFVLISDCVWSQNTHALRHLHVAIGSMQAITMS